MVFNFNFDLSGNFAKNFGAIQNGVEAIAKEKGVKTSEVIDDIIKDLSHYFDEEYKKELEEFEIVGASQDSVNEIIISMKRIKKGYIEKENKEEQNKKMEEKWQQVKEIFDKELETSGKTESQIAEELIQELKAKDSRFSGFLKRETQYSVAKLREIIIDNDKKFEEKERRVRDIIREIESIVKKAYTEGDIESISSYLDFIVRGMEIGEFGASKMDQEIRDIVMERLESKAYEMVNNEYFEQVERFTNGFEFLRDYPEVIKGLRGVKIEKFTDRESYYRYCDLRRKLQVPEMSEYDKIEELLENPNADISGIDRKILEARRTKIIEENSKQLRGIPEFPESR